MAQNEVKTGQNGAPDNESTVDALVTIDQTKTDPIQENVVTDPVAALYDTHIPFRNGEIAITEGPEGRDLRLIDGENTLIMFDKKAYLVSSNGFNNGRQRVALIIDFHETPQSAVNNAVFEQVEWNGRYPTRKPGLAKIFKGGTMREYLSKFQGMNGVAFLSQPTQELRKLGQFLRQMPGINHESVTPANLAKLKLEHDNKSSALAAEALLAPRTDNQTEPMEELNALKRQIRLVEMLLVVDEIERQSKVPPPWERS